jgi:hypothetical protein
VGQLGNCPPARVSAQTHAGQKQTPITWARGPPGRLAARPPLRRNPILHMRRQLRGSPSSAESDMSSLVGDVCLPDGDPDG